MSENVVALRTDKTRKQNPASPPAYAELAVTSNFSFLRGASHPEDLVKVAKVLGLAGIGIADRNSVAGVVRMHVAAKQINDEFKDVLPGLKIAVGTRLAFADGTPDILAYPHDRAAWGRLTRLLSLGKRRAEKGDCILRFADLLEFVEGLNLIVMPPGRIEADKLQALLLQLKQAASKKAVWLAAGMLYRGDDLRRLKRLAAIAEPAFVPLIAVNDVLYHAPERRALQDVVTCIREHLTLEAAGRRLESNAERHLKPPREMARLFHLFPQAVSETVRFLDSCKFSLEELRGTEYADETRQGYATPQEALVAFAEEGFKKRFPNGTHPKIRHALNEELRLIGKLNYAPFFLTVDEIVRYARSRPDPILCQGRGSAANSIICYCLGITDVSPQKIDLLFERFVSEERNEPPDIDVDFEHERREEVIQHIYEKYGRERAGLAATVICYRGRSAVREVGKVFGLSEDSIAALASTLWGWASSGVSEKEARRAGLDPSDSRLKQVMKLAEELIETPRHLSQHVGGFVITRSRLDEVVPIENAAMEDRTVIEWEKDDLEAIGLLKVDVLALGMLSCLKRSFDFLKSHYGVARNLAIQDEDKRTYAMIQRADTIGVFQIESRAQMSMLPRLRPQEFYDLVIEVAIVRPGPIQGNMVHPYLRRREDLRDKGIQPVFPGPSPEHGDKDELKGVLEKTLGVPLFQEHAMRIAIVAAGFRPGEADRLRRAMATFKRVGTIGKFRDKFINGMTARGYDPAFATNCWNQIEGFGSYGFPESHAASFANLVYASSWIKCHFPDVFAAALLNSQPMGFYAPAQLVRDAQEHGVEVRSVDINRSNWDCTLEPDASAREHVHSRHESQRGDIWTTHALRLGLRQISGFSEDWGKRIEAVRGAGFDSVRDLWLRTGLPPKALKTLAHADAFNSLGLSRRDALWAIKALRRAGDRDDLPLFARAAMPQLEPDANLPPMPPGQQVVEDYRHLELSLKAHPVSFLRHHLDARKILRNELLPSLKPGPCVTVAGLVLVRQRPGTGNAIFMTLEDETGIANAILWPRTFEQYRPVVMGGRLVSVTGVLQNEKGVIHIVAEHFEDLSPLLRTLSDDQPTLPALLPGPVEAAMPKGRNFH
ncbi:MAG TPA: error-prone DNA polymerase [Xanthobacteraceae bacterium]|nr:error-prone DNA polymerase [Xanthobacteraceae bacterium]